MTMQLAGDVDRRPGHDISIQRSTRTRPGQLLGRGWVLRASQFNPPPAHLHGRYIMSMDVILDEVCIYGPYEKQRRRRRGLEHRTNNSILEELEPAYRFLAEVKRRKTTVLRPCHVVRADNLCTYVLHGIFAGKKTPRKTTKTLD